MEKCNCTIDCETVDYRTSLSFSRISTFDTEQILRVMKGNVSQRVINAREVFYRKNNDTKQVVDEVLSEYIGIANVLKTTLKTAIIQINMFEKDVKTFTNDCDIREKFHDFVMDRLVYNMRSNFVRGWDVKDERYLTPFTQGYINIAFGLQYVFDKIPNATEPYKSGLYATYDAKLQEYINLTLSAKKTFSDAVTKVRNLKMLSIYRTFPKRFYNNVFVHKNLLHYKFKSTDKMATEVLEFMDKYHNYFHEFQEILKNVSTGENQLSKKEFQSEIKGFRKLVRRILFRMYMYKNNTVDTALSKSLELSDDYNDEKSDFNRYKRNLIQIVDNIISFGRSFERTLEKSVIKAKDLAVEYMNENATMLELMEFLHSSGSRRSFSDLYQQLDQLTIQTMTLHGELRKSEAMIIQLMSKFFSPEAEHIYKKISNDIDCLCNANKSICLRENLNNKTIKLLMKTFHFMHKKAYGSQMNFTCDGLKFLFNCDYADRGVSAIVSRYQTKFYTSFLFFSQLNRLTGMKSTLESANDRLIKLTEKYQEEIKLSKNFIKHYRNATFTNKQRNYLIANNFRNNLIQLQIYYDSLSTTNRMEEPAYGTTQLFSDIGGNIGLCMGGSIISMIEIFDFIIVDILRKIGF